jgi:hypothetical protein
MSLGAMLSQLSPSATLVAGSSWRHPLGAVACRSHHVPHSSVALGPAVTVSAIEKTTARNIGLFSWCSTRNECARFKSSRMASKLRKDAQIRACRCDACEILPAGAEDPSPQSMKFFASVRHFCPAL